MIRGPHFANLVVKVVKVVIAHSVSLAVKVNTFVVLKKIGNKLLAFTTLTTLTTLTPESFAKCET